MMNSASTREQRPTPYDQVFPGLTEPAFEALLKSGCEKRLGKDTPLFNQGEPHVATYFILDGLIKTYYIAASGKVMTLACWPPGHMVGGPEFFERTPHTWSASAATPSTVLAVDGSELLRLAEESSEISCFLTRMLTVKVKWLSGLIQLMSTESVTDRLAHLLIKLGDMYGKQTTSGIIITQHFTQEELAAMVCASRQWVNLALNRLHRSGLIAVRKRQILLIDVPGLQQPGSLGTCRI